MQELGLPTSDAPEGSSLRDKLLQSADQASRFVDRWVGRDFIQHDYTASALDIDEFDGYVHGVELWFPYAPVITLTEITVDDVVWVANTDYRLIEKTTGDFDTSVTIRALSEAWSPSRSGDRLIKIKGKFGYYQASTADVPTGIPSLIGLAALRVAAVMSGHAKKEIVGIDGSRVEITEKEIDKMAQHILGKPAWKLAI